MSTLIEILIFLVQTLASVYLLAILLRFLMQLARANFYNPISQLVVKLTNPVLLPLRKVVPGLWGIDLASLILALGFHWLVLEILVLLKAGTLISPITALIWSLIGNALYVANIYLVSFFVIMIASFVAPFSRHPALVLIFQVAEPFLAPFRRLIPPTGGIDLSLFFASIALYVIRMALNGIAGELGVPGGLLLGSLPF